MKLDFDVVIIGAGVAGMTAAIYLKRSGINCCLLERDVPGGQINKSSSVKNYPGFIDISGPDLSANIFNQVQELGVTYKYGNVLKIEVVNDNEKIVKTDLEEIHTQNIIVATGRKSRKLDIPGEAQLIGKGVSYCALCDANFFKNEDVAVIGGGNSALEEAIYLSNICKKVTIVYRKNNLPADDIFKNKINQINNIEVKYNSVVQSLNELDGKLKDITIKTGDNEEILPVKGCFIYIGQIPANEAFKDILEFDDDGYIKVNEHNETNIKGVYAAGDIIKKDVYQLLTAMNDGVISAINCTKDIKNK